MVRKLAQCGTFAAIALMASAVNLHAQGCKAYPYSDGLETPADGKIISTASASVSFDDVDSVKDARQEAVLQAKAQIAQFFSEGIQKDEVIYKLVNESKTMQGQSKANLRKETIARLTTLRSNSKALLRGVVQLGDCYTKGTEVRVTVGIKPETIAAAERTAGDISSSLASQPAGTSQGDGKATKTGPTPLTKVDEFSNTKNLKKF